MLTKRERQLSSIMILCQIIISLFLFIFIDFFFNPPVFYLSEKSFFLIQILIIWYICFDRFKLGIIFRTISFTNMLKGYLVTVTLGSLLFFLEIEAFSLTLYIPNAQKYIALFAVSNVAVLVCFKYLFYHSMAFIRRRGRNTRHAIIIADGGSINFIEAFIKSKDWGFKIKAIFTADASLKGKYQNVRLIHNQEYISNYILNNTVDDIFFTVDINDKPFSVQEITRLSKTIGVTLHIMESTFVKKMRIGELSKNFSGTFETIQTVPEQYFMLKIKDLFDIIFSLFAIIVTSPLMVGVALMIKIEDGGPIFFSQERIGLNGRRFHCLKFRSMVVNAEELRTQLVGLNESDGPTFKMENDPRITRIGKFIRKTSLDELPQFFNVLKNEMSIVGPRPPLYSEVIQYEQNQIRRLSMKPGITCIWQVWGRNSVSFKEWMKMDLRYIDNWSIWLDLKIIVATVSVIFKANGR